MNKGQKEYHRKIQKHRFLASEIEFCRQHLEEPAYICSIRIMQNIQDVEGFLRVLERGINNSIHYEYGNWQYRYLQYVKVGGHPYVPKTAQLKEFGFKRLDKYVGYCGELVEIWGFSIYDWIKNYENGVKLPELERLDLTEFHFLKNLRMNDPQYRGSFFDEKPISD